MTLYYEPAKKNTNCSVNIAYIRRQGQTTPPIEAYLKGEQVGKPSLGKSERYLTQTKAPLYYTLLTPANTPSALRNLSFWEKLEMFEDDYASKRYSTAASQKTNHSPTPSDVFRADLLKSNPQEIIGQLAENPSLSLADLQETHESRLTTSEQYIQSAITAQVLTFNLPTDLDLQQTKDLVITFTEEHYVSRGLGTVIAIYDQQEDKPPYAEMIVSLRPLTPEGQFSDRKDREIMSQSWVRNITKQWSEKIRNYHSPGRLH